MPIEIINAIKGQRKDFNLLDGETWQYPFTPRAADNSLIDLTGVVFGGNIHRINKKVTAPDFVLSENNGIVVDRVNHLVTISKDIILPKQQPIYYYGIWMLFTNLVKAYPIYGQLIMTYNV